MLGRGSVSINSGWRGEDSTPKEVPRRRSKGHPDVFRRPLVVGRPRPAIRSARGRRRNMPERGHSAGLAELRVVRNSGNAVFLGPAREGSREYKVPRSLLVRRRGEALSPAGKPELTGGPRTRTEENGPADDVACENHVSA